MTQNPKSKFGILVDTETEKLFFAVAAMHAATQKDWFTLDEVAEFVRHKQELCERSNGTKGQQFALWPRDIFPDGWSDHRLASVFCTLTARGILDHRMNDGISEVAYVAPEQHRLHKLRNPQEVQPIMSAFEGRGTDNLEGETCP